MIEVYSEKLEPKQSTIEKLLLFSKSISTVKSEELKTKLIINLN
ncbi:hypothetical protein [Chishuiella sp.]|nr:hypothetical protein [Chishuiella sp.]